MFEAKDGTITGEDILCMRAVRVSLHAILVGVVGVFQEAASASRTRRMLFCAIRCQLAPGANRRTGFICRT
jgi:hypothetical protein